MYDDVYDEKLFHDMQQKDSLVQEGESGQQRNLNQEHAESPNHLELHEYLNMRLKIKNDYYRMQKLR